MKTLNLWVPGLPVAQPRPRAVSFAGHARLYNPGTSSTWKACVIKAAADEMKKGFKTAAKGVPVCCNLTFYFPRPASHFGTGRNAGLLKANAPIHPTTKPDRDNLCKSTEDALTAAAVWMDDAQVTDGRIRKRYTAHGASPGCMIEITEDLE